jgi:23S rRNA pseudouridine2605 synthase
VERGKWRLLSEKEIRLLKYLNASYKKTSEKEKDKAAKEKEKAAAKGKRK